MSNQLNPFAAFTTTGSYDAEVAERVFLESEANNVVSPLFASLSVFHQSRALKYAAELQIDHYEQILSFGQDAQQTMNRFTSKMLQHVQRNDTSRVRDVLQQLTEHLEKVQVDDLIEEERSLLKRIFSRPKASIQETMSQYNRLSKQVDRLGIQLNHLQIGLLKDHHMLDDLYKLNEEFFQELNVYIAAGELKKYDLIHNTLPAIQQAAGEDDFIATQQLRDLQSAIESLDKRLYDLQISREIAIQCAPQIRMIQQTGQMLMEKIQSSTMTTIPLWQSQITMLLSMNNQRRLQAAGQRLENASAEMARKNEKMYDVQKRALNKSENPSKTQIEQFKETQQKLLLEIQDTMKAEADVSKKQATIESNISRL